MSSAILRAFGGQPVAALDDGLHQVGVAKREAQPPDGGFDRVFVCAALAGGVALAIMMIPTITRATEEMLLLVPQAVREAAYGLGVPRWRTTLSITLRTATSGVITGVMLAFARVAGETAPLLFTAFGNQNWNWKINQPTAALSLQVYTYAISPFDEWHRQAWAGALILIILIVAAVGAVRIAASRGMLKGAS